MESRESMMMMKLNSEYLELCNRPEVRKAEKKLKVKKMVKEKKYREIIHILYGRIIRKKLVLDMCGGIDKTLKNNIVNNNDDFNNQKNKRNNNNAIEKRFMKIAVYTCIVGGYDTIKEPYYVNPSIDYILFSDRQAKADTIWKIIDISTLDIPKELNNTDTNRYLKMHPHLFLSDYDYSIYIDGSIMIVADMEPLIEGMGEHLLGLHRHNRRDCIYMEADGVIYAGRANRSDVRQQTARYKREGYPQHNGLYENTIIVRKHNDSAIIILMEEWWREYYCKSKSKRDQISLPYVIWKTGFNKKNIKILGNDLDKNPRFRRILKHDGNFNLFN